MSASPEPSSPFATTPFTEHDEDLFGFSACGGYPSSSEMNDIDLLGLESPSPSPSMSPKPEPEKERKPVKKRKSWGQELPIPTTNLPPRKRAKTPAEKEQRRIERVLRNRAAAQASRERRRKELEVLEDEKAVLEKDNNDLKDRLSAFEEENASLAKRVEEMQKQLKSFEETIKIFTSMGGNMIVQPAPSFPTFTNSNDPLDLTSITPNSDAPVAPSRSVDSNQALDMTHHSAALMCDLQCLPTASNPQNPSMELVAIWMMQCILLEMMTSTLFSVQMPFLQLFLSLKKGTPIPVSDLIRFFPLIRWLVSTKPTRQLRQRLLTCSPTLALLSKEATGRALLRQVARSASGQFGSGVAVSGEEADELDPASECRRIVSELRTRACLDDLGPNKMGGGGVDDIDFLVGVLNGKTWGERGA